MFFFWGGVSNFFLAQRSSSQNERIQSVKNKEEMGAGWKHNFDSLEKKIHWEIRTLIGIPDFLPVFSAGVLCGSFGPG